MISLNENITFVIKSLWLETKIICLSSRRQEKIFKSSSRSNWSRRVEPTNASSWLWSFGTKLLQLRILPLLMSLNSLEMLCGFCSWIWKIWPKSLWTSLVEIVFRYARRRWIYYNLIYPIKYSIFMKFLASNYIAIAVSVITIPYGQP